MCSSSAGLLAPMTRTELVDPPQRDHDNWRRAYRNGTPSGARQAPASTWSRRPHRSAPAGAVRRASNYPDCEREDHSREISAFVPPEATESPQPSRAHGRVLSCSSASVFHSCSMLVRGHGSVATVRCTFPSQFLRYTGAFLDTVSAPALAETATCGSITCAPRGPPAFGCPRVEENVRGSPVFALSKVSRGTHATPRDPKDGPQIAVREGNPRRAMRENFHLCLSLGNRANR
jgi:hypothetical protein